MKTIILIAFAAFAVAQEKFEVKELKPADVQELQQLNRRVEEATAKLAEAQKILAEAKTVLDTKMYHVKREFQTFEGACESSSFKGTSTTLAYFPPIKKFKRIELKGKYALITSGSEECGGYGIITGGSGLSIDLATDSNARINSLEVK